MARRTAGEAATKRMEAAGGKRAGRGGRRAAVIVATTMRCRRTRTRARRMAIRGMETRDSRSTASCLPVLGIRPRAPEIHPRARAAMGLRALATGPLAREDLRVVAGTASLRQVGAAGLRIGHGIRADTRGTRQFVWHVHERLSLGSISVACLTRIPYRYCCRATVYVVASWRCTPYLSIHTHNLCTYTLVIALS
ncbi:uncharacterized protein SCHCODRAFT_01220662 [Schizophyllum commune H4-8]|uniref:uncharacterized protein n=1 Tax=Schizophyllum commune (strain H4-8 / FGSC 9210) TaxID=578458 RepID=UPI002160008B|nr:uncharacterized protein SCHCODRAFT_01220662 [Schizophyllum commune H4-8]KAI5893351.1 hypothetical protein SCHCODRAFT_01220662 [Schizophyllum commune H4-8]